jgi:hypothetical protein
MYGVFRIASGRSERGKLGSSTRSVANLLLVKCDGEEAKKEASAAPMTTPATKAPMSAQPAASRL